MIKLGNSLGHRSIPVAFNWLVDPLSLNPYLYFDGSENVTTAGGAVSSWSQVIAGTNQLNKTLGQLTGDWQPDNASEKSIDFDGTEEDRLAFDVAVAQAGVLIVGTSNGCFAFVVNSDSVDEITALGWETGYFQDLDLFAMVLLPTTVTDREIAGVIQYFVDVKGATRNPTGSLYNYWYKRTDILIPKFDAIDFSGVSDASTSALNSFAQSGLISFPSISWAGLSGWDVGYMFYYCTDLASFEAPTDTSGVTILVSTFAGCSSLTSMPVFDTSNVTNFGACWMRCGLTSFPEFDVSSGTNFYHTWFDNNFTAFPNLTYNDSSAINFSDAWDSCSSLTSFPASDLSKGTNFYRSWYNCTSLASFPSGITFSTDPSDAVVFTEAWKNCTALTEFPVLNLAGGTSFNSTWMTCSAMTSFNATGLNSGTDFQHAWNGCSSLTSFPALSLASSTNFSYAWNDCADMASFLVTDMSSGTNFSYTWTGCAALTSMPAISLAGGTTFIGAWNGCTSLTSFLVTDLDSSSDFYTTWKNCTSLVTFPAIPLTSGTRFQGAWQGCTSMTTFLATGLDSGTNFSSAWNGCTALTAFPAHTLSAGTTFYAAWYNCSSMTSFLATGMDLGTNFGYAWNGCSSLVNFPANVFDNWSPASVSDNCFKSAWGGCTSLSATSVENILDSLATAGVAAPSSGVDIRISYDEGTGTPSIASAVATLKGLSPAWTITLNGVAQ